MNDSVAVGVVECFGNLPSDLECLIDPQLALAPELLTERFALHVRRDVVEAAGRLTTVEEGEDVRLLEGGGENDFMLKSFDAHRGCHVAPYHFERDRAAVAHVACEVDGCHSPCTDLTLDPVPVGETRL